ncbi:MAG: hypothetical protein R2695_07195 [Acidimicrobiales bacterium]
MMEPKWVISMKVLRVERRDVQQLHDRPGVDQVVPVDVCAPGCPPGRDPDARHLHRSTRRSRPGNWFGAAPRPEAVPVSSSNNETASTPASPSGADG